MEKFIPYEKLSKKKKRELGRPEPCDPPAGGSEGLQKEQDAARKRRGLPAASCVVEGRGLGCVLSLKQSVGCGKVGPEQKKGALP